MNPAEAPGLAPAAMTAVPQFVRKVSGFRKPSQANTTAFGRAVDDVAGAVSRLLDSLETTAP